jgi:hypothetical protein
MGTFGMLNAYDAKHKTAISNSLTQKQLSDATTSVFLETAVELRLSSRGPYESCYAASQKMSEKHGKYLEYIKLEMDLLRKKDGMDLEAVSAQKDITIQYQFPVA